MRIIAKKYDGITHENTSELELARLQSELRRTDDVCNPVYNPSILTQAVTAIPNVISGPLSYKLRQLNS